MKSVFGIVVFLLIGLSVQAQNPVTPVRADSVKKKMKIKTPPKDGFTVRADVDSNVMVPFADVREEDVFYAKRIWREVDQRYHKLCFKSGRC